MKSIVRLKIKASAIDFNQHVNYSVYLKLYSKGQNALWKKYGLSFKKLLDNYNVSPFIRYMEVEYMDQLFEGDRVTIYTSFANIGTTSVTYEQKIWCKGMVVNKANMVAVFTQNGKATPIPKNVKKLVKPSS